MPTSRTVTQGVAICLGLLCSRPAPAQADSRGPPQCVPAGVPLRASAQTSAQMYATLVPAGDSADAPAMYLATLLQEALLTFQAPDTMAKLSDGVMAAG